MSERMREGSGGPKVFESKKEKKRRLILSDSESEEYDAPPPRKKTAPGAEQNGNGSDVNRRDGPEVASCEEELKVDKKRDVSSDAVKAQEAGAHKQEVTEKRNAEEELLLRIDKKRDVRSGDVKQREEAGADRKKATEKSNGGGELKAGKERAAGLAVFKRREETGSYKKKPTERRSDEEKLRVYKQGVARPDAVNQRDEAGTDQKKAKELRNGEEELKVDKKWAARPDVVRQIEEANADKKRATEKRTSKEEPKVDKKRAVSLNVVKNSEETGGDRKRSTEKKSGYEELKVDKKGAMNSNVARKREESGSDKKRGTEKRNGDAELRVDKKWVVKSDVIKQWEEVSSDKKKATELRPDKKDLKFDKKSIIRPDVVKQREQTVTTKKKATEFDSDKEDLKFDKKRSARSDEVKKREEAGIDKKKVTELGSDRKRIRETPDAEISLKRIKTELKHGQYQTEKIDGTKMKLGSHKHGDVRTEAKGDQVLGSKLVVPAGKQRDVPNQKNSPAKSGKTVQPEAEKVGRIEHSGQRTIRKLKGNSAISVGIKREGSGITRDKGIRLQGKGGILTVLPSNKKVGGLEKVHIRREDGEKVKSLTSSSLSTATNCSTPKDRSLSGDKRVLEKLTSTVPLGKNQLNMNKISSAEKHKSREAKSETKDEVLLSRKPDVVSKGESNSSLKTPPSATQNTEEATVGRGTVIRKIREQIKGILLSAGWKIDLRPRRGRNYEDQVYIPPTGGSGYWSITKAYAVYQKQLNSSCDDKNKNLSEKSSEKPTVGVDNLAIPVEFLSMLKRKVVNKRRRRVEVEETRSSRSKKAKETTKMKHPKNKKVKDSTGRVKGRKKLNSLVGSNTKGSSGKSNTKQRGCALLVRGSNQEAENEYDDYIPYIWKRTVLSWMIDLGVVSLNGKVKYMNKKQTRSMLEGQITRDGIHCSCCSKILTVSKFEIHAGSKLHQPYENIFVEESGISLLQCQLDAWEKQDESERRSFYTLNIEGDDPNDDTCGICGDGGDLICCDGCPSTFHQSCLGIDILPSGDWYCTNCSCRFCGLVSEAAQGSSDPDSLLLPCYQCEKKYHQECIPEEDSISTSSNNSRASFCGKSCRKVFRRLQKLLGVKNDLEAGFSWRLIRRLDEDSPLSPIGLPKRAECNAKIAVALAVMDECFLPIFDQRSRINLIHNIVYNCGSNFNRLNYSGFYTFVLERADEIICAASIRIHGTRLAEMPFIGTRNMYRRQGMCRRLLNGIESALCFLGIQKLVIPAISELTDTWTTVFGFKHLAISQKQEVKSINMLVFPGTGLLQKPLLKRDSSEPAVEADKFEPGIKHHHTPEVATESSVGTNLHASDEVIVHSEDDVKEVECSFPALDSCVPSTSDVAPESFNAPHASEFQAPKYKSPENAADGNLFIQPKAVCHDVPIVGDKFQVDSLTAPKIKLLCEDIVPDNHDVKIEDAGGVSNSDAVEDTSVQHISEARCTAPDAIVSTLPDCGTKASSNLPCIHGTLLPHDSEAHCTSSGVTASTLRDSGGNDLHIPVSSLDSISDATHHNGSNVRSTSCSLFPVEHSLQTSGECILDSNHDIKDQVANLRPKLKAFGDNSEHCSSEINIEFVDPVTNKFYATSMESNTCVDGEGTAHAIHEVRTEVAAVKPKPYANDDNAEPYAFRTVSRLLNIPFGKESQASYGSSVTYVSDVITKPVSAASGHGLQVSDTEKPSQQDSELVQGPPEFPDAALPFATVELHNEHNSIDALHLSSLPEPSDSSNNSVLKRSHETNNGSCPSEQNFCVLGENYAQYHASDMVCKSPDVAVGPISSSSGVKNCKKSGVCPHADAAYSLTPDVGNGLDMVAKDSASFVLGGSDLCASVLGDTHNEFGNALDASDHCTIPESTKQHSAEGIGELDGLCKNNNAVRVEASNKFLCSTSVVVQHDLTVEATAGVPIEPSLACSEGASDTGISKDELAVVKLAPAFGLSSANCASKVVTISLDNGSESADVSI